MDKLGAEERDARIWALCNHRLEPHEIPCEKCPEWFEDPDSPGEKLVRGCRVFAQELLNIALFGNPWGKPDMSAVERAKQREQKRADNKTRSEK